MLSREKYSVESGIKKIIRYVKWIMVLVVCAILFSGVIFVEADEVAMVIRFGKLVGETRAEQVLQPGLHFTFPYIIDNVVKVPVKRVHEIKINDLYTDDYITDVIDSGYAITGDGNVVVLDAVMKYQIIDPVNYAVEVKDADKILKELAVGELVKEIAGVTVDYALTDGKEELAANVIANTQNQADKLGLGVQVVAIEFTELQPPIEVKADFEEVTSAYVEKTTMIQEANTYKDENILGATAIKDQTINNAKSDQIERVAQAEADVTQFYGLIDEYRQNPRVVVERIYRDRINAILNNCNQTIIVPDGETVDNLYLK